MKLRFLSLSIFSLLFSFYLSSCESKYDRLVSREMATGVNNDSLVFGLYFGDTRKEFFRKCWDLNQQGVLYQGPDNKFVKFSMKSRMGDSVKSDIQMLFYGIFNKGDIMTGLDMKFSYEGWSSWNKSLHADQLLPRIKDTLDLWFSGNDFILIPVTDLGKDVYVKVDANRQIVIYSKNDKDVVVKIENLNQKYIVKNLR